MTEWRPKGFVNPYTPDLEQTEEYLDHGARDQSIFEDGADAVVVALRGSSESLMKADVSGVFRTLFSKMTSRGMWVFIPDGKAG